MFFNIIRSKKGISFVEILVVVIVLGILTAVAVPIFSLTLDKQKIKDCQSQCTVIEAQVREAMYGMIDNGAAQYKRDSALTPVVPKEVYINFSKVQSDHKTTYAADTIDGNGDDEYKNKECFVLIYDQQIPGKIAFTLGDLRGGYRPSNIPDYNDGCKQGYHLKKKKLENTKFYEYLANVEIPVCPYADYKDSDTTNNYFYYIFEDGTVLCSCPKCHE